MKKTNFLLLALAIITMGIASCGSSYKAKEMSLKSQEDSLNYYLGYLNGSGIKDQYMVKDSSDKAINEFMEKLEKAFKNKDEMQKLGYQIGFSLKQMNKEGLMGDSTLKLNVDIVKQGLINGLKDHKEGMNAEQAQMYIQTTMQKMQQKHMMQQPAPQPQPVDTAAVK